MSSPYNSNCFQILINNKLVTQTASSTLGNDFTLHIGQTYRMALSSWPRCITLEVVEGASLRQSVIASAYLPIPSKTSLRKEEFEMIEFSGSQVRFCFVCRLVQE